MNSLNTYLNHPIVMIKIGNILHYSVCVDLRRARRTQKITNNNIKQRLIGRKSNSKRPVVTKLSGYCYCHIDPDPFEYSKSRDVRF